MNACVLESHYLTKQTLKASLKRANIRNETSPHSNNFYRPNVTHIRLPR